MCGETRIPLRDMCAGNTLPGETYITVTPALLEFGDVAPMYRNNWIYGT